jgi:hypothetical protein
MFVRRHTSLLSFHTTPVKSPLVLGLEAVILKTVAKVGVACRPPKRNISPRRCLNPLRFLVFDSETAEEPEKSHVPLMKTVL